MSRINPEYIGKVAEDINQAYLPFLVWRETNNMPRDVTVHAPQDASIDVANGRLPDSGGVINFDKQGIGAVDLLAIRKNTVNEFHILPTQKKAVDEETDKIVDEGGIVLTWADEGRLRIFALAMESKKNWQTRSIGGIAIQSLGLDAIDCNISEYDKNTGLIVAHKRTFQKLF